MALGRYVLTADVVIPAGVASYPAAGPATVTAGTATGATPAPGQVIATQTLATGNFLLSWTATLQTAAAAGDVNNFGLYGGAAGTTLLATSVNAGTVGSYPQAAMAIYTGITVIDRRQEHRRRHHRVRLQRQPDGHAADRRRQQGRVRLDRGRVAGRVVAGTVPGDVPGRHATVAGQRRAALQHDRRRQPAGLDRRTRQCGSQPVGPE